MSKNDHSYKKIFFTITKKWLDIFRKSLIEMEAMNHI